METESKSDYRRLTVVMTPDLEQRLLQERARVRKETGLPASKSAIAASILDRALTASHP